MSDTKNTNCTEDAMNITHAEMHAIIKLNDSTMGFASMPYAVGDGLVRKGMATERPFMTAVMGESIYHITDTGREAASDTGALVDAVNANL